MAAQNGGYRLETLNPGHFVKRQQWSPLSYVHAGYLVAVLKVCCRLLKRCMLGHMVIYVKCINCSYNNVAKSIRLLDIKAFFVYTGKSSCK